MKTTPIHTTARVVMFSSSALAVALAAAFPALAQTTATPAMLTPVIVTANGIPTRDSDATYASEVHDRKAIDSSGAASLYDYLAKNTSLNVMPGYGNKNAPLLDMRGYGTEAGFQNMVVVVDGYRLNNIDQVPAYLGGIPLEVIESIEISKGSGSVSFGDGAMSGVIQIRTRARNGASISAMTGSRGAQDINVSAGLSNALIDLSANANNSKQASLSSPDPSGHKDGSDNRAENLDLTIKPLAGLKFFVGGSNAHVDTRYPNALSPSQFAADPGQSNNKLYSHQIYESNLWRAGAEYEIVSGLTARYMHNRNDIQSDFTDNSGIASRKDSNYSSDDLSLSYRSTAFDISGGVQRFDGSRLSYAVPGYGTQQSTATKDNTSVYLQGVYRMGALSLSGGARREKVEYSYTELGSPSLNGEHKLNAWDLGANYRFNQQWSGFANLNQSFQAPDVDRFFTSMGTFNGFVEPAKARTFTIGANHDTATNRLRVATFYSKLKNEIYYDPNTTAPGAFFAGVNSNIDKSHKYGLEVSDRWQALESLSLSASYTYTRSIIDEENSGGGAFNGNEVPGVPRHGLTLGATYQPWTGGTVNLSHAWRDSAYSISNFQNDKSIRQAPYNSTSLSLRQRWKKIEAYVAIDNLFDQDNGVWVYSAFGATPNNVYPVDFRRTARVGIKVDLF
jgi:iron complex outermembrane recepter protein